MYYGVCQKDMMRKKKHHIICTFYTIYLPLKRQKAEALEHWHDGIAEATLLSNGLRQDRRAARDLRIGDE